MEKNPYCIWLGVKIYKDTVDSIPLKNFVSQKLFSPFMNYLDGWAEPPYIITQSVLLRVAICWIDKVYKNQSYTRQQLAESLINRYKKFVIECHKKEVKDLPF